MRTAAQVEAVFQRLRRLERNPPLFNDRVRPKAVRRRLERLRHWCGLKLWSQLCSAEASGRKLKSDAIEHRERRPPANGTA